MGGTEGFLARKAGDSGVGIVVEGGWTDDGSWGGGFEKAMGSRRSCDLASWVRNGKQWLLRCSDAMLEVGYDWAVFDTDHIASVIPGEYRIFYPEARVPRSPESRVK